LEKDIVLRGYLGAIGRSAGGLLIGSVMNLAPHLFRVMVADVPFMDCLNTMIDPTIPLVTLEYSEWGNPANELDFENIRGYSPYENLDLEKPGPYPILFVQAGLNDKRVCYFEPAKYVAKYRHLHIEKKNGENAFGQPFQVIFKTEMGSGHFSKSGRYDLLKEDAYEYAFLIDQLAKVE
jgi:oligopeptidase B